MRSALRIALPAILLLVAAPAAAKGEPDHAGDLDLARKELQQARDELRRAAIELARITRETDPDSPRARAFEMVANPRRAVLGVGIAMGPEKRGEIRGVLITAVTPGSGADKAGLKSGDLMLTANGTSLAAPKDQRPGPERKLRDLMRALSPGDKVRITYERDGEPAEATVIAQRPEGLDVGMVMDFDDHPSMDVLLPRPPLFMAFDDGANLKLASLDDDLGSYFQARHGVLVVRAPKESLLGLKSGDVIQKIDGEPVGSPVEAMERLRASGNREVALDVVRHGKQQSLKGKWIDSRSAVRRRLEIHDADEP